MNNMKMSFALGTLFTTLAMSALAADVNQTARKYEKRP